MNRIYLDCDGVLAEVEPLDAGDSADVDVAVLHLDHGMRIEVYNATGTPRLRATIDRPTTLTLSARSEEGR